MSTTSNLQTRVNELVNNAIVNNRLPYMLQSLRLESAKMQLNTTRFLQKKVIQSTLNAHDPNSLLYRQICSIIAEIILRTEFQKAQQKLQHYKIQLREHLLAIRKANKGSGNAPQQQHPQKGETVLELSTSKQGPAKRLDVESIQLQITTLQQEITLLLNQIANLKTEMIKQKNQISHKVVNKIHPILINQTYDAMRKLNVYNNYSRQNFDRTLLARNLSKTLHLIFSNFKAEEKNQYNNENANQLYRLIENDFKQGGLPKEINNSDQMHLETLKVQIERIINTGCNSIKTDMQNLFDRYEQEMESLHTELNNKQSEIQKLNEQIQFITQHKTLQTTHIQPITTLQQQNGSQNHTQMISLKPGVQ